MKSAPQCHELRHLCEVGFEWIAHDETIVGLARNRVPVDYVGQISLPKGSDGLRAAVRPGVGGGGESGVLLPHEVIPFADAFGRLEPEEEAAGWIDVVIFEIEALQPRVVPGEIFRRPEGVRNACL